MTRPVVETFLARCGLSGDQVERLDALDGLYDALVEANRRTNLTRVTDPEQFWTLHVADSLSIALALPGLLHGPMQVADVGCGAGFPLLPLAWANPQLHIVGFEPRGRKVEFVQSQIAALGLPHAAIETMQAREAGRDQRYAGRFDVVLLRAVGKPGRFVREVRGLLSDRTGATIAFYKTPEAAAAEIEAARREAEKYALTVEMSEPFELPGQAGTRQFVLLQRR